jgi:hypothetical protein
VKACQCKTLVPIKYIDADGNYFLSENHQVSSLKYAKMNATLYDLNKVWLQLVKEEQ